MSDHLAMPTPDEVAEAAEAGDHGAALRLLIDHTNKLALATLAQEGFTPADGNDPWKLGRPGTEPLSERGEAAARMFFSAAAMGQVLNLVDERLHTEDNAGRELIANALVRAFDIGQSYVLLRGERAGVFTRAQRFSEALPRWREGQARATAAKTAWRTGALELACEMCRSNPRVTTAMIARRISKQIPGVPDLRQIVVVVTGWRHGDELPKRRS